MAIEALAQSLRSARERAGYSQEAAALAIGINRVLLSYYESGDRPIPFNVVVGLCRLYGMKPEDLIAGIEQAEQSLDPQLVLRRQAPTALERNAEAGIALFSQAVSAYVEIAHLLGEEPGGQHSPFRAVTTRVSLREIARLARELRIHLGLGPGPIGDLFTLVDDQVLVFRLALGGAASSPSGLFFNHPLAGFCIVVNTDMAAGRQLFTLAHELGHAYFHSPSKDVWISMTGAPVVYERFCDDFASEFLIPEDALARALNDLKGWEHPDDPVVVVHLQHRFGVSYLALLLRLRGLRLIDPAQYDRLAKISPVSLARSLGLPVNPADVGDYKIAPLQRFPGRMLRLVRTSIVKEAITEGAAAELLGVSRGDVNDLLVMPQVDAASAQARRDYERVFIDQ